MALPFVRFKIPAGSRLLCIVQPEVQMDTWVASGEWGAPDGTSGRWSNAKLRQGVTLDLTVPGASYHGYIDLDFASSSSATIKMKIVKPDGTVHSIPYGDTPLSGPPMQRIYIGLFTLRQETDHV